LNWWKIDVGVDDWAVEIERGEKGLRQRIERTGRVLYEGSAHDEG
jgi:hypothetical protein